MISEARSSQASVSDDLRKKRLLKMMVCMVVIFGLCWLPVNALNILRDTALMDLEHYFVIVFLCAHLCSMSATMWNPILYAWMNDNFRREFKAVLPCFNATDRLRRTSSYLRGARRSTAPAFDATMLESLANPGSRPASPFYYLLHRRSDALIDTPDKEVQRSRHNSGQSAISERSNQNDKYWVDKLRSRGARRSGRRDRDENMTCMALLTPPDINHHSTALIKTGENKIKNGSTVIVESDMNGQA